MLEDLVEVYGNGSVLAAVGRLVGSVLGIAAQHSRSGLFPEIQHAIN